MKKIISLLIILVLVLFLFGCTNGNDTNQDTNLNDGSAIDGVGDGVVPPHNPPVVPPIMQGSITGIWESEDLNVTWAFLENGQAIVKGAPERNFDDIYEYEIRNNKLYLAGTLEYAEIGAEYEVSENELIIRNNAIEITFKKIDSTYFDKYEEIAYEHNRLIGTWINKSGMLTTTYTFNKNGTGYYERVDNAEGAVAYEKVYPQGFVYTIVSDKLDIYNNNFRKSFFTTVYGTIRLDLKDCQTCLGKIYNKQ
jgi:hypothetical protein